MLQLLGGVRVVDPSGRAIDVGGPRQRLLLTLLGMSANQVVSVDRLTDALWHDEAPADPRAALQVAVSKLRRSVGGCARLDHLPPGYVLRIDPDQVDVNCFEDLVERGTGEVTRDPERAATLLRDALAMVRDEPFGELTDRPALAADAGRIADLGQRALEGRIEADLVLGRGRELVAELRDLTRRHPLQEGFWSQLMRCLYGSGRQAEALEAYTEARTILADQLGIDPSPALQDLHRRILDHDPGLTPASPAEPDRATDRPIRTLRGYELYEEIGSGGFGIVYRGRQPSVDREVAVKVIRREYANDPDFIRRFEIEAQTIARLEHLHIVPLHDYWREPDAAYLVMRWLRGGSLEHVLRRGPWNLRAASRVVGQVAGALDLAHRHGVVHGDVKPANVLLDEQDNAYLSDFAIEYGHDGPPTAPGSIPWTTPEHVTRQDLTPATDVFGLGLVAYALFTGRHPYQDTPPGSLRDRVLERPLPADVSLRSGLPRHVAGALDRATAVDPGERYATAAAFADALVGDIAPAAARLQRPALRNPFKGLRPFTEADADDYFGREPQVRSLLERLQASGRANRFLAVVGPSGSGKSSLVRAGLVPALRRGALPGSDRWFVTTMVPGDQPLADLERALVEVATGRPQDIRDSLQTGAHGLATATALALPDDPTELFLLIDQFEEVYTLADEEGRATFSRLLQRAVSEPDSRLRVVVTLRSDMYDDLLVDAELGELAAGHTFVVSPLTRTGAERAIVEPAAAVGVSPDPDTVVQIVRDVEGAPGALPLLQFALTELFDQRSSHPFSTSDYERIGGVRGALARRAEGLWSGLDPRAQEACRDVLLRLVTVGDATTAARRRVHRGELLALAVPPQGPAADTRTSDEVVAEALEALGTHRLVTFDRDPLSRTPTVEVAHEALLEAWDRLRAWIETRRGDIATRHRLGLAVGEWVGSGRDGDYLLRATRLDEFTEWARATDLALTESEHAFLAASEAAARDRDAEEQARRAREVRLERRSRTRLRSVAVVSVVGALVAAVLSGIAIRERDRARAQEALAVEQQVRAEEQEREARARQLSAAAVGELGQDPERSILLAMEAVSTTQEVDGHALPEAQSALRQAVRASHVEHRLPTGSAVDVGPDGRVLTLGMDGAAIVWADDWEPVLQVDGLSAAADLRVAQLGATETVDVAPDGATFVVAGGDRRGAIRDATSGSVLVQLDGQLVRPQFTPDGTRVVAVLVQERVETFDAGRSLGLWDAATGELLRRLDGHTANIGATAISPDGQWVATTTELDGIRMMSLDTGRTVWRRDEAAHSVTFHPAGDQLALGTDEGEILLVGAGDGEVLQTLVGHAAVVSGLAFTDDGERLVSGGFSDGARVWDLAAGRVTIELLGHEGIQDVAVTAAGTQVLTTSQQDTTTVWDIQHDTGRELAAIPIAPKVSLHPVAFRPDGSQVAVPGIDGRVTILDVDTMEPVLTIDTGAPAHGVTYSGDGTLLATASTVDPTDPRSLDQVDLWDASTGRHVTTLTRFGAPGYDIALDRDGSVLVHAGSGGLLSAVDTTTGAELYQYEHPGGAIYRSAFTPDGSQLVVGATDAGIVADAATGEIISELTVERSVTDVAFFADRMVTAEVGARYVERDLATGDDLRTVGDLGGGLGTVAVVHDLIATADARIATVADLETGEEVLQVEHDAVDRVRLSPDGRRLAVVTARWVHFHVVETEELLALASTRLTRGWHDDECERFLQGPCPGRS